MGKKRRVFAAKAKFGRKHSHLYKTEEVKQPTVEVKMKPAPVVETKPAPPPVIEVKAEPVIEDIPKKKPVKKRRTRTTARKKVTTKSKE
jgi:hypothetical protein